MSQQHNLRIGLPGEGDSPCKQAFHKDTIKKNVPLGPLNKSRVEFQEILFELFELLCFRNNWVVKVGSVLTCR